MALVGKTGVGKSTLMENLMAQDARNGEGFCLIDPHGQLAEAVLRRLPESRKRDVLYFDPADTAQRLGFNILENRALEPALVVSGVVSVLRHIWDDSWGPRLEYILRNALWTLVANPSTTLSDIRRVLTDRDFRLRLLQNVEEPEVAEFWEKEYGRYSEGFRQVAIAPILNKVGQFLLNPFSRTALVDPEQSIDVRRVMDDGKILIANLSKGRIGEDASALLGSMLLTQFELAALARADVPEDERRQFTMFVDEFGLVATDHATGLMAESRKYKLCLVVALQYVEQLERALRDAVFENVGTLIAFRLGPGSASYLAREFKPVFDDPELQRLPPYNVCLRLVVDGVPSAAFTARTILP